MHMEAEHSHWNTYQWYAHFQEDREDVKVEATSDRPPTENSNGKTHAVYHLLIDDHPTNL